MVREEIVKAFLKTLKEVVPEKECEYIEKSFEIKKNSQAS
ncbi:NADH dehydrogenase [Bacillus toyonensis]|nr:NADH dehydrogenase [Bacillus toyonensis]